MAINLWNTPKYGSLVYLRILLYEFKTKLYGRYRLYIPLVYFPYSGVFYLMNTRSNIFMDFNMFYNKLSKLK